MQHRRFGGTPLRGTRADASFRENSTHGVIGCADFNSANSENPVNSDSETPTHAWYWFAGPSLRSLLPGLYNRLWDGNDAFSPPWH